MTQEDKELLLKDLSARLPYGVKVETPYNTAYLIGIINRKGYKKDECYIDAITDKQTYPIRYIKPYLRLITSMTEKEKEDYRKVCELDTEILSKHPMDETPFPTLYNSQDWLNEHHFDYRGLIPKGLAIKAPKEMYYSV